MHSMSIILNWRLSFSIKSEKRAYVFSIILEMKLFHNQIISEIKKYDFAHLWIFCYFHFVRCLRRFFLTNDIGSNYDSLRHVFYFLLAISQVSLNPHIHTTFTMVSIDFNESLSTDAPCEIEKKEACS